MKKYITVVYEIVDSEAWRDGGNPLNYRHHGLAACRVAIDDALGQYICPKCGLRQESEQSKQEPTF